MLFAEGSNTVQDNCEGKVEGVLKVVWQKADKVQVTVGLWDAVAVAAEELAPDWRNGGQVCSVLIPCQCLPEDGIHKGWGHHANV